MIHAYPAFSGIVGAVESAVSGFHHGPNAFRVDRRNRYGNSTQYALRHSVRARDIGPGIPSVRRFPQSAARSSAVHAVRLSAHLPESCINGARICRVHSQVNGTGFRSLGEHEFPGLATVCRTINAALRIRSPKMAQGRDVNDIGIFWMDHNRANLIGLLETHVLPCVSTID